MSDQDRLQTLQQAATNANPSGNIAIKVSDLRWLVENAEVGMRSEESKSASSFPTPKSNFPTPKEASDVADRD